MAGYTRQSSSDIATGKVIEASHFNQEYNKLESAFNVDNGHKHDGTVGEGHRISVIGPAGELTVDGSTIIPKEGDTISIGSNLKNFKELHTKKIFIGSDELQATAEELNLLDDAQAGTVNVNKAVIYDGEGKINANGLKLSSSNIDLTASELNFLDGAEVGTVKSSKAAIYSSEGTLAATVVEDPAALAVSVCCY